ncbi:hypothetical protein P152DRAFT_456126 [Eremomyces bilateralis CBS 781.70]|uniref:Uncharacterized protein n=1 Tax=Eremomyces bilateralis CBS 781.70 TaxID=1392243 RepID=A0A6G1GAH1_9PEZI|nr:uncharacterized protein P152DRAFT_456126 [Eremomyces bilateralis CBS 781.70]KAF1815087.1 hypothetical protein P152DRAFT_456126 [Eremomyces bilateralis CBS 781.70]
MAEFGSGPDLQVIRGQILQALQESIVRLKVIKETSESPVFAQRVTITVQTVETALKDLEKFWGHINRYSTASVPRYLKVHIIDVFDDAQRIRRSTIESLEEFWVVDDVPDRDPCRGRLLICSPSQEIQPRPAKFTIRAREPAAICRSGLVAFLVISKRRFEFSARDLCDLIDPFAVSRGPEEVSVLNDRLFEDTLSFPFEAEEKDGCSKNPLILWSSSQSYALKVMDGSRTATQLLRFPSPPPDFKTRFQYMEIWEPHSFHPSATRCATWGARSRGQSAQWTSIMTFGDTETVDSFTHNLHRLLTGSPSVSSTLGTHWGHVLKYVFAMGINDARMTLRAALRSLDKLKYDNAAKPKIGSAHACLMYMNHMDFFQSSAERLRDGLVKMPSEWALGQTEWMARVSDQLYAFEDEVVTVRHEAKRVRQMIIEQHSLFQSRQATILTVLASIFIPLSFVASFFGMNTWEINGSSWKLKWYFITSIPLATITVFLPLVIIPVFNSIVRKMVPKKENLKWTWIVSTILLLSVRDITRVTGYDDLADVLYWIIWVAIYLLVMHLLHRIYSAWQTAKNTKTSLIFMGKQKVWWFLFWLLAAGAFVAGVQFVPFVELAPFGLYFGIVYWRLRNRRFEHAVEA